MFWARVDNRLIHGQIIETWIPFTGSKLLIVANDELAGDVLRQEIISLAIPTGVSTAFLKVGKAAAFLVEHYRTVERSQVLILFASCCDALHAFKLGLPLEFINIGNIHYGPGKRQLCAHVSISPEDEICLRQFTSWGVKLDFRCLPSEPVHVRLWW